MDEREQIEHAISALEAQRSALGNAAVDAALAGLKQKLASLHRDHAGIQSERAEPKAPLTTGERKLVTVLFSDVVGSVSIAERLDPEEWKEIISGAHQVMSEAVCRWEGRIAQFMGDGALAYFGAPLTREDDPVRAVRAGLAIQEGMIAYRRSIVDRVENFQLRVGIHTGLVVAGDIGIRQHSQYVAFGDTVNLAARLQSAAEPGTVLISEQTHRLVERLFEFVDRGEIALKGKMETVHAYVVTGESSHAATARGISGLTSPMVGREEELALLSTILGDLCEGKGHIIWIMGDAGIGKSRLMAEFRRRVLEKGIAWLEGRTLSFGQSISYWPFQEILRTLAGIAEEDHEASAWDKLEMHVKALCPGQVAEILPYLASLLNLQVKSEYSERVKYLDGEALGKQIFLASRRFFESLARQQPTVLVFEDLHWVDESSARLVEHLLSLVDTVPLLIVGVSRPGPETPAAHMRDSILSSFRGRYTDISLSPLTAKESETLVDNLLAVDDLSPSARAAILFKAEGNPFFLEEILRALIELGAFVRDARTGRWRTTAQIESVQIPDTVQGVIMARIDRLDEEVKQVLRLASVIGRSFLYRVLREVAQASEALDDELVELERVELIRRKRLRPELEYIFKHALAQEATYESILLQNRRRLHKQVAEAVSALFAGRLEEFYGLLAYHYAKAEVWEKAQEYLLKAADQSGRMAADAEALAYYRQAMEAYTKAFGDKWDPLRRAGLEHRMGKAFFRRGEHQQALTYLQRSLGYLGKPLPTSTWGVRSAILGEMIRQAAHRLWPGRFVAADILTVAPEIEETIRLHESAFWIELFSNPQRSLMNGLIALNISESKGFYQVAAWNTAVGLIFDFIPIYSLAENYHRRAISLLSKTERPEVITNVCGGYAQHNLFLGRWERELEFSQRAAAKAWDSGLLHEWGMPVYQIILARAYRGNLSDALPLCQNLIRYGQEGADVQLTCWGLSMLGFVLYRLGRCNEALAALHQAAELARIIPDKCFCIMTNAEIGRCHISQGRLTEATVALDVARKYFAPNLGADSYASLRNGLAEAYLAGAEGASRTDQIGWMKKAGRACQEAARQEREFRPGLPEALRLQGTYEWLKNQSIAAQKWWQRSLTLAESMGQQYDAAKAHLEMGQRLGDRSHLEKAEAIFAEIGAAFQLERTRQALAAGKDRD